MYIIVKMGAYFYLLSIILFTGSNISALIIPEELPSILSLVFANIPPVKKGTDSRIGLGFRLGEHADFQTIIELGPQKETQPIGNGNSESKRRRQIFVDQGVEKNFKLWNKSVTKPFNKISQKQIEPKNIVNDQEKKHSDENWLSIWSKEFEKNKSYKVPIVQNPTVQKLRVNVDDRT